MDGQVTWLDLGISCGKTWSEPSAATKEKTSQPCSKRSSKSSSRKPPVLKCLKRAGQIGGATTMKWEDDGAWYGALTTRNTGEKPSETAVQEMCSVWGPHSVAEGSRLSQILEETPHPKYNLTAKACQGILRRAERRGKDLPKLLKEVLLTQSASGGGCDGGGKGALVQTEKSGTLGCGNDQTIFAPTPINLMVATRCEALGRGTGFGVGEPGDPANTISAAHSHGVFAPAGDQTIFCLATQQGGAELRTDDGAPTLTAAAGMSGNNQPVVCAAFKLGNSEQARSIGYEEELSPTLNAECGGNKPAVVAPAVALDMTHACDVIRECGEQVPALQARMGTGGNQVPCTYGIGNGQAHEGAAMTEEVSQTLNTMHDAQAVMCSAVDCRNFTEGGEINGTLQAKSNGGQSLNMQNTVRQNMVVRRLTPMECERLQGYPDHWTDIGEWTDEKGKKHKDADSPRYKALGNSIALPFWEWMLRRMARDLPEGATLGSLFDGIGGFPLCFERIHGKGTARWASEIEQFPIAVTKKWFGEG